jgi:hypothetical protein
MLRGAIACALVGGVAAAQPSQDPFESCKARRRELTAEAMKVADAAERGRLLAAMPSCERADDGTTAVVEPPPAAPLEPAVAPHVTAGLRVGASESATLIGSDEPASGLGPFIELEGGWRLQRRFELALFASYSWYRDTSWMPGPTRPGTFDVHDAIYDIGARVRLHYDPISFGAGIGVELEHGGTADYPAELFTLMQLELEAAYEVTRTERLAIDMLAIATAATDLERDLISVRLAFGIRLR